MSILDNLIEKKDIESYLEMRSQFLRNIMEDTILNVAPEDREYTRERFVGRIHEIKMTLNTIRSNTIKDDSKFYYRCINDP